MVRFNYSVVVGVCMNEAKYLSFLCLIEIHILQFSPQVTRYIWLTKCEKGL